MNKGPSWVARPSKTQVVPPMSSSISRRRSRHANPQAGLLDHDSPCPTPDFRIKLLSQRISLNSSQGRFAMSTRACALCLLFPLAQVAPVRAEGPGDSVVKIFATQRGPDLFRPWNKMNPSESVGSGVIIDGNRI